MTTAGGTTRRRRVPGRLGLVLLAGVALGGAPPSAVHAQEGTGLVELAWPAAEGSGALIVERSDADGPFRTLATLPAGATSYRDATLPPGQRACYRVRRADDEAPQAVAAACVESPAPGLPPVAAPPPGDETTRVRQRGPDGWYQRLEIPAPGAAPAPSSPSPPPSAPGTPP